MRKIKFVNDGIYHIYNRGVEKRQVFMDDNDYFRFIHDLFEFNDLAPAGKFSSKKHSEAKLPNVRKRDLQVEVICFCLMPNHFHLIVKQIADNGITQFLHKLGTGYAKYFNDKYQRVGSLFQGSFKAIDIKNDEYLLHLSRYIHLNPVELIEPKWKKLGIKNWSKINKFLNTYRWSSYNDYLSANNFPSVTSRGFLLSSLNGKENYKKFVEKFVVGDLNKTPEIISE